MYRDWRKSNAPRCDTCSPPVGRFSSSFVAFSCSASGIRASSWATDAFMALVKNERRRENRSLRGGRFADRSAILANAMLGPVLSFPPFRLDVSDERLWRDGTELKLRRKPFAILKYLATHPKRLVTQDDLIEAVWGKVVISESLLRTHMRDLRQVIGDSIIET